MRTLFKLIIGLSALFIAACGAYFSVKGLSLLFVGSAVSVMVMAASLELGKLVAASFLYRYWRQMNIVLRTYMVLAVLVLIGITSLGIYGYSARAYEQTNTRVALLEHQIGDAERDVAEAQHQIDLGRNQVSALSDAGRADVAKQQQIVAAAQQSLEDSLKRLEQRRQGARDKRDKDIDLFNKRLGDAAAALKSGLAMEERGMADLNERLAALDRAVDAYTKEGGGAFLQKVDHIKQGQDLRQQQQPERDKLAAGLAACQSAIDKHRADYAAANAAIDQQVQGARKQLEDSLSRFDDEERQLRAAQGAVMAQAEAQLVQLRSSDQALVNAGSDKVDALNQRVAAGNEEVARLRQEVAATDIGSYRFVARAFNAPVDDVVKWLILIVVLVFDPLAVTLTVGFNVALLHDRPRPGPRITPSDQSAPGGAAVVAAAASADGGRGAPSEAPRPRAGAWWRATPGRRATPAVAGLVLILAAGLGFGGYSAWRYVRRQQINQHAQFIPAESFAVAALRPAQWHAHGAEARPLLGALENLVPGGLSARLGELTAHGFNPDSDIYLFLTYPHAPRDKKSDAPVLLLGLVAAVNDPAAAEAGLAQLAESLSGVLLPHQPNRAGVTRSRAMVQYGRGRYLDPEGGFFTFALSDSAAIAMVELEGDPSHPVVEEEIRQCLAIPSGDGLGQAETRLPARATPGGGAATLWFDAHRCFAQMPKNAAAQNRYLQLQRCLDFDMMLMVDPMPAGQLQITGDYHYAIDKFKHGERDAGAAAPAQAAAAGDGGVPGRLMDRCAQTLDFEAMIDHLRQTLSTTETASGAGRGGAAGGEAPQVVVQKMVSSERDARFVLQMSFAPEIKPTVSPAVVRIGP